jgi:hypothetical protein
MNILVDIAFPDGTEYYSIRDTVYNSNQYIARISSITGLDSNMGSGKTYEVSPVTVVLNDMGGEFRAKAISHTNRFFSDISVIVRNSAGTILRTTAVQEWRFPPGMFVLTCSLRVKMDADFTTKITTSNWPDAHPGAIGTVAPMAYNTVTRVKAWKGINTVDLYDWVLGKQTISTVTRVEVGGVSWPNTYWALGTGNSPGGDPGWNWLNMGHGVIATYGDFAYIDVTTPAYTPLQIITDLCADGGITVGTNAAFATFLSNQGYTSGNVRYLLQREMTPSQALAIFCESFECNWRFDSAGEVEFIYTDRAAVSVSYSFQFPEVINISPAGPAQPDLIKNQINYQYDLEYQSNQYDDRDTYDGANQGDWGIFPVDIDFEYLTESVQAAVTATEIYQLNREPRSSWNVVVPASLGVDYQPGDYIRVSHPDLETPNPVLFFITRASTDTATNETTFQADRKNWLGPTYYILQNGFYLLQNAYRIIQ